MSTSAAPQSRRMSRAKPLRDYYRDFFGLNDRQGPDRAALRADYKAAIADLKGKSLKREVESICFECVGGDSDPGPKLRVRDCRCRDCPLHPVRPWQSIRGRAARSGDQI